MSRCQRECHRFEPDILLQFSLPAPFRADLYRNSASAEAKTGWAALTGFDGFLTQQ